MMIEGQWDLQEGGFGVSPCIFVSQMSSFLFQFERVCCWHRSMFRACVLYSVWFVLYVGMTEAVWVLWFEGKLEGGGLGYDGKRWCDVADPLLVHLFLVATVGSSSEFYYGFK